MPLQLATLVNRLGPASEKGVNEGENCIVQLVSGDRAPAYVKSLSPRKIAVEAVCALLAELLDLPVPAPLLVLVRGDAPEIRFGSAMIDAPPFRHWISLHSTAALERVKKWKQLISTACFDEWVANPDRHAGNLLHDGRNGFWLIDHELALAADHPHDAICEKNIMMAIAGHAMDPIGISTRLWPQVHGTLASFRDASLDPLIQHVATHMLDSCDMLLSALVNRQANLPALGLQRLPQAQGDLFHGPAT